MGPPLTRRLAAFIGVASVAVAFRVVIAHYLPPLSDVYYYDSQAVSTLLAGMNPYGHAFTGIPPALMTAGAQSVFAYLPGVLLYLIPFAPFDVRVAMVAAELAVGLGIFALGGRWSLLASAVLLLFPFGALFSVVYLNNALPAMALFGLGVLMETRNRGLLGAALIGGAMASSQFIWLALPFFALLWYRKGRWTELAVCLGVAVAIIVPFLVWNPSTFVQNAFLFELSRPVYPLVSNTPWGINFNPSLSGVVMSLYGTSVPAVARGLVLLAVLSFFIRRGTDLQSSLLQLGYFLTVAMFVLPGSFFWVYLELPLQAVLMSVAVGPMKSAPRALNA